MEVTETIYLSNRFEWRKWLQTNHRVKTEIWLVYPTKLSGKPRIPYLDAVEEALCFGWIDGIEKKHNSNTIVQRFTPRRPKSNWTELNKERAKRLIAAGKMTDAGLNVLPDLSPTVFKIADDILLVLQSDPQTWQNFENFPDVYKRIRIGFIEEMRKQPIIFQKRLDNFLKKTRQNKMFGVLE